MEAVVGVEEDASRDRAGEQGAQAVGAVGEELGDVLGLEGGLGDRGHEVVHVHVAGWAPGDDLVAAGFIEFFYRAGGHAGGYAGVGLLRGAAAIGGAAGGGGCHAHGREDLGDQADSEVRLSGAPRESEVPPENGEAVIPPCRHRSRSGRRNVRRR